MSIQSKIIDQVGIISLDRPEKANAYDRAHLDALAAHFDQLSTECRIVIIQSSDPRFFCAGADLNELKVASPSDAQNLRSQAVFTAIARSKCISIATVEGAAIAGGCELALASDLRVIGANAVFRLPETALGIIPAAGGVPACQPYSGHPWRNQSFWAVLKSRPNRPFTGAWVYRVVPIPRRKRWHGRATFRHWTNTPFNPRNASLMRLRKIPLWLTSDRLKPSCISA